MEVWFVIIVTLCISAIFKSVLELLFSSFSSKKNGRRRHGNLNLPPGPPTVPVIGNLLWLRKSFSELEPIIRNLKSKHGPLVTLWIGSRPAIFVGSHSLAHRALVQNGAVFSDRPTSPPAGKIFNSNQHNISSATYGATWRLLRRNLTSEILHPSRVKSYSAARRWVLGILVRRLSLSSSTLSPAGVTVMEHFQYAMFCLLALMCFGDKLHEDQIKEIETVLRRLLLQFGRFNLLSFWPKLTKILFHKLWKKVLQLRQEQENVLIPLIKARIEAKREQQEAKLNLGEEVVAYVDTLVDLELPDEKRKLNYPEMVTLCGEFLNAGTDTTSTSLQWIMANLVKHPNIQDKLYQEIVGVVGPPPPPMVLGDNNHNDNLKGFVNEEDLQDMPYLKAVVLEALRRHPPGHFVLPHKVTEDVELDGYLIPKNASVNFTVADMGWDPKVWDSPMEFKPERFLAANDAHEVFDITGSKEIKMMPFGAGRRICPGSALALLHLEYLVANLVWYFEWMAVDGHGVDLSEKQQFTVVMKNPLQVHLSPRNKST